ncbi:MAG: holo-ACP synthase [Fibrobacterota bacterium]
MISGLGSDIVEVERIKKAVNDPVTGKRFLKKIFTKNEQAYCFASEKNVYQRLAARWAAKEAFYKAWNNSGFGWLDIEIKSTGKAPPYFCFPNFTGSSPVKAHLSITHTESYAAAFVIAEKT